MRYTNLLPVAAVLARAIVIPDDAMAQQLRLEVEKPAGKAEKAEKAETTTPTWWDAVRSAPEGTLDFIEKSTHKFLDDISDSISAGIDHFDRIFATGDDDDDHHDNIFGTDKPGNGHVGRPGHHGTTNLTVYQAIQASNYTKKFAALVNDFPDIVDLLNSTKTNVTVFVPVDKAFEKIPEHGHRPPKEIVESILQYHVLPGLYPAGRLLASHTLPTALKSPALGDRPQRLRASVGLFGFRINFYSKVVVANLFAKNGIAHGVDSILVPPPRARRLISLFPSRFSTLELAAEKTGLLPHHEDDHEPHHEKHDHTHGLTGLTIFAPTNAAFARLGPAANAFLFNTEKGLGYLRALLKYHIVANQTLYSDAYYGVQGKNDIEDVYARYLNTDDEDEDEKSDRPGRGNGHFHIDLPTLLDDKSLSIDIARWYGFIKISINAYQSVAVEDGIAFDGVVQVLGSVLIPPRGPKEGEREGERVWGAVEGEISVEELVERLRPYVEDGGNGNEDIRAGGAEKEQVWGEL
ncbi:FAS1 domain-containing protein [Nemania sp. NC0429]|nr:FAS1 domain-containing protein [Nemania sp. NC0429]